MLRRFILIFSFILFSAVIISAETVQVDNKKINQYNGYTGKWMEFQSMNQIRYYANKFGSSFYQIHKINQKKNFSKGDYLFLPYSKKYLSVLKKEKIQREKFSSSNNKFIWPLRKLLRISSFFGMRWGTFHPAIDLPTPKGTPVIAAMDGRVVAASYINGHGNSLLLEHRNNLYTRYSHNSVILVKKGDFVKKGQIIALAGSTGNSTGNHLHFEIRYKNIPLNPLDFLPLKIEKEHIHFFQNNEYFRDNK